MTQPTIVDAAPTEPRRHRVRSIIAPILGIIAVLVLMVTIVAVWAAATVLRPEPVARLTRAALEEPDVQAGLATYVADQVSAAVDLQGELTNLLPNALDRFAPVIADGVNNAVERALTRVLANEDVQQTLVTLVERTHGRAMDLLRGDGLVDGISVQEGGQVVVNLLPIVGRGLTALQSLGLFTDVEIPEMTADGDPEQQAAELSTALGRDLPEDFGQLVVYQSDSVGQAQETVQNAQRLLVLAKRALVLLLIATVVLVALTIVVAPRKWRAVLVLGLGTAAAMVVLRSAVRRAVDDAPALAQRPGGRAAIESILGGASTSLIRLAGVVLIAALVAILVALVFRRWARADLVLVAAVVAGTVVFAVLGFSLWALLLGAAIGIGVWLLAGRVWRSPPREVAGPAAPAATA
jgi:hypothetical protein